MLTETRARRAESGAGTERATRKLLIGVGNPLRGDDGAGWAVARHLSGANHRGRSSDFEVRAVYGEAADLVEAFRDFDSVLIIDAARSGSEPGTLHRLDASSESLSTVFEQASTHGLGLGVAVELARALGCLPDKLLIYGIEGADFSPGADLSPEVRRAVFELVQELSERGFD